MRARTCYDVRMKIAGERLTETPDGAIYRER